MSCSWTMHHVLGSEVLRTSCMILWCSPHFSEESGCAYMDSLLFSEVPRTSHTRTQVDWSQIDGSKISRRLGSWKSTGQMFRDRAPRAPRLTTSISISMVCVIWRQRLRFLEHHAPLIPPLNRRHGCSRAVEYAPNFYSGVSSLARPGCAWCRHLSGFYKFCRTSV